MASRGATGGTHPQSLSSLPGLGSLPSPGLPGPGQFFTDPSYTHFPLMVRLTAAPPTLGQVTEIQVTLVWVGITSHSFISERRAEIGAQKEKEPDSQVPSRQAGLLWEGFPGGGTLGHFGWALASTRDSPVLRGPVGGFSLSLLSARVAVTSLSPRDPGGPTLSLGPLEVWLGGCRQQLLSAQMGTGHGHRL